MQTKIQSQTARSQARSHFAIALFLVGASALVLSIPDSKSKPALSSPFVIETRHPTDESANKTRPHHPKWNNSGSRDDQKQTEKPGRTILRQQVVHIATNRRRLEDANGRPAFGKQPGPLVLGRAQTVVGDGYQSGELADICIKSLAIQENPDDLNALFPAPSEKSKPVLVFVHGFYVEFEEAIQRVTQIVHELDYDGHVFVYTWPSVFKLTFQGYVEDQNAIKASVKSCCRFLGNLADHFGAKNVQLLGHSLGCRLIAKTIQSLPSEGLAGRETRFQSLMFVAPDIELNTFKQCYLPDLKTAARRVTIYSSSKDGTLALAESLDGRPPRLGRLGLPPGSHPLIELVNYSSLPGGILNRKTHNLYREHPAMVQDIQCVLTGAIPLSDRKLQDMTKKLDTDR